ncbi:cellulose synthase/poly-beta-1,6-N-acetylglucosamine synthase-like glycosyltransferase [Neobacillus niacini]|uniref:glycosyltransferase family 2 protein n=1 Tax=Neobacillus niacini TaxID=86668 RepID=UPI002866E206|nr:glycosyltransferase family 2 protein [Neobacillus niacini]MDR7080144.1 cellulose synthase/poly-beta-1,6-N-acetylglucosamine synthase-like glycosyltransferase [Neobacillus niacini]
MDLELSTFIEYVNFFMFLLFALMYSYQMVYMFVAFQSKKKGMAEVQHGPLNRFAVIIAARNEELVIGHLISSIKNQNYPKEFLDVFVVADNCTDQTAQIAREAGAIVRERFNKAQVGKGYALDYMLKIIGRDYSSRKYDGFLVFDADNLLDENYIAEMNKTFNQGYKVVTSYRNSKNYDQNWISAGYALWFLHEAEYLNLPRMVLQSSCAISGTGFLVNKDVIKENGGWIHHLLTEDIEFSVSQIIKGEKIGYCKNAIFYDEQPATFSQSWNQRLRWAKGFYQVFAKYGRDLVSGIFQGKQNRFSCFDMTMTIMPAMLISCISILINGFFFTAGFFDLFGGKEIIEITSIAMLKSVVWYYGILFILGFITTVTEWKNIHCSNWKKIAYAITFPLFMFTYIPISVVALFRKVEWKPIAHTVVKSLDDVR